MTDLTTLRSRLLESRAAGDFSPPFLSGTLDLSTALQLQLAVLEQHESAGARVGGWKVGLTSEASRQRLGADERPFGFVVHDRVFDSGVTIDSSTIVDLSIEAEMCFTIGQTIDNPQVTPIEVLDYVAGVSAGFELNEARSGSVRPDFFAMVTDCLTNWGIVGGASTPPTDAAVLSRTQITMQRNGNTVFSGVSLDHVDDHTVSLCRLVEQLARHDRMLHAGDRVITGAFARFSTTPGDHWTATFSDIGTVEARIV